MYTATRKPPTTAWARHLDAVRRERGWSATRLFEEVYADLNLSAKSRTAFLPLLHDAEPDEHEAAVLRAHFGEPNPDLGPEAEPVETPGDLTAAITALVDALDRDREERLALTRAIAALAESLAMRQGSEESPVPPALRGTAG